VNEFKYTIHEHPFLNYGIPFVYGLVWMYLVPGLNIWAEQLRDWFYSKLEDKRHTANIEGEYKIKQKILAKDNEMYQEQSSSDARTIKTLTERVSQLQFRLRNATKKFVTWNEQKNQLDRYLEEWNKRLVGLSSRNFDPLARSPSLLDTATAIINFYTSTQSLNVNLLGSGWVRMVGDLEESLRAYYDTLPFNDSGKITNAGIDPVALKEIINLSKTSMVEMIGRFDEIAKVSVDSLFPELKEEQ